MSEAHHGFQRPLNLACSVGRTHLDMEDDQDHDSAAQRIPTAWWVGGLLVSGAFCTALLTPMLNLPVIDPLAAVGLALLVAVLAVRALGQTDLNPVSGVGKLSQVGNNLVKHRHPRYPRSHASASTGKNSQGPSGTCSKHCKTFGHLLTLVWQ